MIYDQTKIVNEKKDMTKQICSGTRRVNLVINPVISHE
jgi:hypothetical protein